ncbi:MAG: polymer-forming cytoskeletal protein [Proteobacteria bacterium]|nr:polymer-forming cytoskeletal protein [Pseudomonadota bacterium]
MKKGKIIDSVSTIVGKDSSFQGNLDFKGRIQIDGRVEGQIRSESGTVIIGETALVTADVNVGIAIIRGEVIGKIKASERIEVYPPGRIEGDILAPIISIDTGVIFNGNCEMTARTISSKNKRGESDTNTADNEPFNLKSFIKTG